MMIEKTENILNTENDQNFDCIEQCDIARLIPFVITHKLLRDYFEKISNFDVDRCILRLIMKYLNKFGSGDYYVDTFSELIYVTKEFLKEYILDLSKSVDISFRIQRDLTDLSDVVLERKSVEKIDKHDAKIKKMKWLSDNFSIETANWCHMSKGKNR
eukprot:UN02642